MLAFRSKQQHEILHCFLLLKTSKNHVKTKPDDARTQGGTTEGAYAAAEAQTEGSFRGKDGERLTLPYAARFGPRKHVRTFFVIVRLFFRAAEGAGTNNDQQ
jgi:hypothetical protein